MELRLAKLRVVIHRDSVSQRDRLARQHVTVRDFLVGEAIAGRHFDLAFRHLRPARRAHARFAGERRWKSRQARAVEDIAARERYAPGAAVESYLDLQPFRFGLELGHFSRHRTGGHLARETLDVDPVFWNAPVEQRAFGRGHHWAGS